MSYSVGGEGRHEHEHEHEHENAHEHEHELGDVITMLLVPMG